VKVKCIHRNLSAFAETPKAKQLLKYRKDLNYDFQISVGTILEVYAIEVGVYGTRVFVCDQEEDTYPTPRPIEIFDIIDGEMSVFWRVGKSNINDGFLFAPKEWFSESSYFEELLDGDPAKEKEFKRTRMLIDRGEEKQ
jgi:hypothetical protein